MVAALAPTVDDAALDAEVDRFARRAIEPRVARPEAPMDPATLAAILGEAEALGLTGSEEAASGLGPWEELDGAAPPARTLRVLGRLARANAAVALVIHQRALARAAVRMLALGGVAGPLAVALEGSFGLGRTAVARWLAERPLEDDDRALLGDAYAPDTTRILPLDPGLAGLLVPTFRDGAFAWELYAASALELEITLHGHGLDELHTTRVRARAAPSASAPATADTLARALAAHQLGLVAIAVGAVERAHALARAYAAQRRQGGRMIDRHPAVLALLGHARAALSGVRLQLEAQGARPLARAELGAVLAIRAEAMPALAEAANAAVQVFGGLGYMRDTGVEKVARDVNVLRAIAGAPPELLLIVAEWERLHG